MRAAIRETLGLDKPLYAFQRREPLKRYGLSDGGFARILEKCVDYTNTFSDREPRLDICNVPDAEAGNLDFLIATDVFEHVLPPVSKAFEGAFKLLKKGGVLIFSVPFTLRAHTDEHFPDIYDFKIEEVDGVRVLKNRTINGGEQEPRNLVFHGGPGYALEMRLFCKKGVIHELKAAGFTGIRIYGRLHSNTAFIGCRITRFRSSRENSVTAILRPSGPILASVSGVAIGSDRVRDNRFRTAIRCRHELSAFGCGNLRTSKPSASRLRRSRSHGI